MNKDRKSTQSYVRCHHNPKTRHQYQFQLGNAQPLPATSYIPIPTSGNSVVSGNAEAGTKSPVRKLSSLHRNLLTEVFTENLEGKESKLTILDFKNMFQFKSDFSAQRVFNIFDQQHQGFVTLQNFIDTVGHYYAFEDDDTAKVEFFIDMYDAGGHITKLKLKSLLSDCVVESGMSLKDPDIENLTNTLFQDCVKDGNDVICKEDLREELKKHEELLSKMSILMDKWLLPKVVQNKKKKPSFIVAKLNLIDISPKSTGAQTSRSYFSFSSSSSQTS